MARVKYQSFIVDSLNYDNAEKLKRTLATVDFISTINIDVGASTVTVGSEMNVEEVVRTACDINFCPLRTKIKRR